MTFETIKLFSFIRVNGYISSL